MTLARRSFLAGLGASVIASPAIVRASSLMGMPRNYNVAAAMAWLQEELNSAISKQLLAPSYILAPSGSVHIVFWPNRAIEVTSLEMAINA